MRTREPAHPRKIFVLGTGDRPCPLLIRILAISGLGLFGDFGWLEDDGIAPTERQFAGVSSAVLQQCGVRTGKGWRADELE